LDFQHADEKLWWETCPPTMRSLCLLRCKHVFASLQHPQDILCATLCLFVGVSEMWLCAILIQSLFSHYYYIKIVTLTRTTTLMRINCSFGWWWMNLGWTYIQFHHVGALDDFKICFIHVLHWMVLRFASSTK
jgi:hypothetical protein